MGQAAFQSLALHALHCVYTRGTCLFWVSMPARHESVVCLQMFWWMSSQAGMLLRQLLSNSSGKLVLMVPATPPLCLMTMC